MREEGYDVVRASEISQARADDQQILEKAISENRVLITLDEHFGDWTLVHLKNILVLLDSRLIQQPQKMLKPFFSPS